MVPWRGPEGEEVRIVNDAARNVRFAEPESVRRRKFSRQRDPHGHADLDCTDGWMRIVLALQDSMSWIALQPTGIAARTLIKGSPYHIPVILRTSYPLRREHDYAR